MSSSFQSLLLSLSVSLLVVLPVALAQAPGFRAPTHRGGALLTGNIDISILWYGQVPEVQMKAILSFINALNYNGPPNNQPKVSQWWQIVESYQKFTKRPAPGNPKITVRVVSQQQDPNYSLGKVLIMDFIKMLIPKATGGRKNTLVLIVASNGVTVQDVCSGRCYMHGDIDKQVFVAVGDPEMECPACSWPFVKDIHEPKGIQLKPPSGNLGVDSMVMVLAGGLAGAVTNPFGDGFNAPTRGGNFVTEATSACHKIFGRGASPGNPGKLLNNPANGGSFNVHGLGADKFLVPGIWNPQTKKCWTPL